MSVAATEIEVLAACERVADARDDAPAAAFVTWLVAQHRGWPEARQRVSRSRWYAHLRLLKRAGLEVPARSRTSAPSSSVRELNSGAGLDRMVGKRIELTARFDRWIGAGTRGTVVQIVYRDGEWLTGVQFDGVPGSYEEMPVAKFVRIAQWCIDDAA